MTIEEYFGDWQKVINLQEVKAISQKLLPLKEAICPHLKEVFKAFHLCPFKDLRVVILGQDPYPNLLNHNSVATGLAFANHPNTPSSQLSPSLKVLRESVINFSLPHGLTNFDVSLEKWEEQGVLLLNSALTCLKGQPGSQTLLWRPFISHFLQRLSEHCSALIYVLMGSQAASFEPSIRKDSGYILKCKHPAFYARTKEPMPSSIWQEINQILIRLNGYGIQWYIENEL